MRTRETERVELAYDGADAQQRLDAALDRLRELHQQQGGPADAGSGHRKPPHAPRPAAPAGCAKYYERVFPFRDVAALLHRTDAESPVQLREVSVDKYTLRGRPVLDFERKLRETLRATGGAGLHAGRAFVPGPQAPRPAGGPAGVEVVLEVDELPPQLVRAVGSAERAEALRWPLMRLFVQLAEDALAALGFTELLRFASGNRGVHTWVLDAHALALTAREREALLEGLGRPRKLSAWPEARRRMLLFVDEYLAGRPDSPRPACEPSAARTEPPRADSSHAEPLRADSQPQLPQQQLQRLRQASPEADAELAELLWPVFDRQVAVDPTHLHRLPLSVHEKTGRVALVLRGADEVPPEQAAMPLASDPQLARKLEPSVAALRDFLGAVKRSAEGGAAAEAGEAREKDGALAAVLPAPGAPWLRQKSKKRKLLSGSDQADAEVPLAPFRVDQAAAADWAAQLRSAAALPEPPSADRAIAGVLKYDTKDWRKRLLDEARQLEKLAAAAAQNDGLLVGEPYTKHVGGRSLTRYPALDESQSVQRLAGASRHAVSGGQYTELDFSAAHPSAAWGACVLHYGLEEAGRLCPSLRLVATNKKSARAVVARQAGCSVDAAKRSISAALNRESTGGGEFMRKLVAERRHMQVALEAHPFVGGDRLYDAKRHCAGREKEHVSLFSHLLQLLEAESLRLSARALLDSGFETGVLLYDGLMVRQTGEEGAPSDGECVKAAVAAAERAVFEGLGFRMTIERREERDREDRESGFA